MKERPLLVSTTLVPRILDGSKTHTRRLIKYSAMASNHWIEKLDGEEIEIYDAESGDFGLFEKFPSTPEAPSETEMTQIIKCPFGKIGDRLWVREAFYPCKHVTINEEKQFLYRATYEPPKNFPTFLPSWKPSIHMPRSACRILLEITDIRAERLKDISEQDAWAEGVEHGSGWDEPLGEGYKGGEGFKNYLSKDESFSCATAKESFRTLWESINRAGSWEKNDWVWVICFKVVKK